VQGQVPIVEDLSFARETVFPWAWVIGAAVAALLVLSVGVPLLRRWWRRRREVLALKRPHREALRELERAFARWRATGYLAFMFRVTEIIRAYLAARFGVAAPARTTSEIVESVRGLAALTEEARGELGALLRQCDFVKFAAMRTAQPEVERLYRVARGFVTMTAWRG
jgi:hypothetical protein